MVARRFKPAAWFSAIMCCIPCCCTPWVFLGIPLGIWAIVMLLRDEVSQGFQ